MAVGQVLHHFGNLVEQVEVVLNVCDLTKGVEWVQSESSQIRDVIGSLVIEAGKAVLWLVTIQLSLIAIVEGLETLDGVENICLGILDEWSSL